MAITIALDVMGGDDAPSVVLGGAEYFLTRPTTSSHGHPQKPKNDAVHFLLFGQSDVIEPSLHAYPALKRCASVHHADSMITNEDKPSLTLRKAASSGMGLAIKSVAKGEAHAVVSAGNTGAYMALSKMILKTVDGVERPAIAKLMPTVSGSSVVLDLGANAECKVDQLVQFGIMGAVLSQYMQETTAHTDAAPPTVGLLNIGSEASKGLPHLQKAADLLSQHVNFYGFVEGNDITNGTTDVVVTDGFSGNIALKSIEGAARLMKNFLKDALSTRLSGRIGALIAKPAFKALAEKIDPRVYNGAVFLGLKGIAVKSHGGTDSFGYAHAIRAAFDLASDSPLSCEGGFNHIIQERIAALSLQEIVG